MFGWAERSLEALKADYCAFLRKKPYHLWAKEYLKSVVKAVDGVITVDVGAMEHFVELRVAVADFLRPVDDLALRMGDVIHNMRVSLDYLAFGIALRHDRRILNDREIATRVQFPICEKLCDWQSVVGNTRLIKWASSDAIKEIEALQPYGRPLAANHDPLLLLGESHI